MDHNEASDYFSISESGSSTSELTNYEEDILSKIAKLKKMISKLENTSKTKVSNLYKEKKKPLNQNTAQVVKDESVGNKTIKVKTNKAKKERNDTYIIEDESFNDKMPKLENK
ncbi:hypothetical protein F8M41_016576 [Gigaspora margarita]|uniref:Uncharacterized protein n=1 Tax=Gigaspora margarita TaxID=4874 RepID=A0A8H3WSP0_GIGMA|nr:hypothetical protein F8M41_016576 [Gigaspora margarita]